MGRQQGIGLGMYEAEVRFYNQLASRASMRTPRCFHAEYDSVSGDFVVVLEDLSAHSLPDQLAGLSLARAELAVIALADLHAASGAAPDDLDWVASVVHERIQGLAQVWPALWEGFSTRFADRLPGAYDLAYVLAGSLTIDDRRASYGFDDLWVDYRLSHLVKV